MHEGSLIASLLRQVEEIAAAHSACRVSEVRIEIGPLSGVEPLLLREAFNRLRAGTIADSAQIVIDVVGLTCCCCGCQLCYTSEELCFVCPACGDRRVDVVAGDSVVLNSCTLLQTEEATAPR